MVRSASGRTKDVDWYYKLWCDELSHRMLCTISPLLFSASTTTKLLIIDLHGAVLLPAAAAECKQLVSATILSPNK